MTVPADFDPSARGRGPAQLYRWYEIKTTDGETLVSRFVGFDAETDDRAEHMLFFEDDEWEHEIPYGEILSCLPMHARYRAREIERRRERDARRRRGRRRHTTTGER